MPINTRSTEHKIVLYDADEDEVRRVILVREDDGGCSLYERSDGALTMMVFGSLSHACKVTIAPEQLQGLCGVLGCGRQGLWSALECYFHDVGTHLSDLQDALDRRGVAYWATVYTGGEVAIRMRESGIE